MREKMIYDMQPISNETCISTSTFVLPTQVGEQKVTGNTIKTGADNSLIRSEDDAVCAVSTGKFEPGRKHLWSDQKCKITKQSFTSFCNSSLAMAGSVKAKQVSLPMNYEPVSKTIIDKLLAQGTPDKALCSFQVQLDWKIYVKIKSLLVLTGQILRARM
ncbi:MAG: hypothetical protein U5L01_18235 [Rheinheimera sp.]|nr:hypothetical protein [Rheinheimera sp.]